MEFMNGSKVKPINAETFCNGEKYAWCHSFIFDNNKLTKIWLSSSDIINEEGLIATEPFTWYAPENLRIVENKYCKVETKDNINPNHYKTGEIEVIDIMEDQSTFEEFEGYLKNNIVKYILRYKHKNGIEDVNKAIWYANRLIKHLEKNKENKHIDEPIPLIERKSDKLTAFEEYCKKHDIHGDKEKDPRL